MKTTEAVINKWPSILPMLGVGEHFLTGKHTSCPICSTGKDRFRFDNKEGRGTYFCNSCGAGDGWKLLKLVCGWEFREAADKVDSVIGNARVSTPVKVDDEAKRRARLKKIASRVRPIESSPVSEYLINRGISGEVIKRISNKLGFVEGLNYWQDSKRFGTYQAMTALVENEDEPATYHITYLENGSKAKVGHCRKIMPPVKPITGGAVQLFESKHTLGIAEGIETAIAATQLFDVPTWAAINASNLESFIVPDGVTELYIFGDNDANYVGQNAAYSLAKRASQRGLDVTTHIPQKANTDWNDVLLEKR